MPDSNQENDSQMEVITKGAFDWISKQSFGNVMQVLQLGIIVYGLWYAGEVVIPSERQAIEAMGKEKDASHERVVTSITTMVDKLLDRIEVQENRYGNFKSN
jgi:hypothetical protein